MPLRIPSAIESILKESREQTRQHMLAAQEHLAQQSGNGPKISFELPSVELEDELVFWEIDDDEKLDRVLWDISSAVMSTFSDAELRELPEAYVPLCAVLEFERQCQWSGWLAINNLGPDLVRVAIEGYRRIGLKDEARALEAVLEAEPGIALESPDYQEQFGTVYASVPNKTPEFEERLPFILEYVRAHGGEFGVDVP